MQNFKEKNITFALITTICPFQKKLDIFKHDIQIELNQLTFGENKNKKIPDIFNLFKT